MIDIIKKTENFKTSGKSQRVWCAENGIKRSTLRYWLERLDELTDGKEVKFAEVITGGDVNVNS